VVVKPGTAHAEVLIEEVAARCTMLLRPLVVALVARGEAPLGGDLVRTMAVALTARVAVVVAMASALRCAAAQREGAIVGGARFSSALTRCRG
jgi:hypothetical protein